MSDIDDSQDTSPIIMEIAEKYNYKYGLVKHWIDSFNLDKTKEYLENLRKPTQAIWIQVNLSRVDFDSLLEIFENLEVKLNKHPLFEDIIEVRVESIDISKEEDLPIITVDRESAAIIALGKDVTTSAVSAYDDFEVGDKVKIYDPAENLMAIGIAEVNSSEITGLSQRVVARTIKSLAYTPPLTELREYRRGLFNVLTPIQAIGVKSLYLSQQDSVLVMSSDKGDVAAYIAELTEHKTPITLIARNNMQLKAITKNLKRIQTKAIRVIKSPFLPFLKDIHDIKYTSVYLEPPNSRSAIIPAFSSILTMKRLRDLTQYQSDVIKNLFRCLHTNASISYITHSIDLDENEKIFKNALGKAYYNSQSFPNEIRKLQLNGDLTNRMKLDQVSKMFSKEEYNSMIYFDPLENKNSGGFVAKFKLKSKK